MSIHARWRGQSTELPVPGNGGLMTICQGSFKNGPVLDGSGANGLLCHVSVYQQAREAELAPEGVVEEAALTDRYDLEC